jgi:hypothetical protein
VTQLSHKSMGTLQRIKHSSNAERDNISVDSFSFIGLVSIQDQQHQSHSAAPKPSPNFEF